MPTIFDAADRAAILSRLDGVTPGARPAWGRMDAGQMVAHLNESLRMAVGELACALRGGPLSFPPLRWLIINVLPFPKGVPTAPELLAGTPSPALDEDLQRLRERIERVAAQGPQRRFPRHPAFGFMPGRQWGVLIYRHVDHHLRQFGA